MNVHFRRRIGSGSLFREKKQRTSIAVSNQTDARLTSTQPSGTCFTVAPCCLHYVIIDHCNYGFDKVRDADSLDSQSRGVFSSECAARVVVLIANTARGKEGNNNQQLSLSLSSIPLCYGGKQECLF